MKRPENTKKSSVSCGAILLQKNEKNTKKYAKPNSKNLLTVRNYLVHCES